MCHGKPIRAGVFTQKPEQRVPHIHTHTHTEQRSDDMMAEQSVENLTFRRWRYKHYLKFVEIYSLLLLQVQLKCRINLLLSAEVQ